LHDQLCYNNLWYDDCNGKKCNREHIRHNGQTLKLFDAHCNLHRLEKEVLKAGLKLNQLTTPRNTEFHVIDDMCDPAGWAYPTNAPQFIIHKCLGVHPKYSVPSKLLPELQKSMQMLIDTGNLVAISTGLHHHSDNTDNTNCKALFEMIMSLNSTLPVLLHTRDTEVQVADKIQNIKKDCFFVWLNANIGSQSKYSQKIGEISFSKYLQKSSESRVTLNAAINSGAQHHLSEFINDDMTRRLYTSTDAPHNAFKQHNKHSSSYSQPLHVIRTIMQLWLQLSRGPLQNKFLKTYTLADFNDLCFDAIRSTFLTLAYTSTSRSTTTTYRYVSHVSFLKQFMDLKYIRSTYNQPIDTKKRKQPSEPIQKQLEKRQKVEVDQEKPLPLAPKTTKDMATSPHKFIEATNNSTQTETTTFQQQSNSSITAATTPKLRKKLTKSNSILILPTPMPAKNQAQKENATKTKPRKITTLPTFIVDPTTLNKNGTLDFTATLPTSVQTAIHILGTKKPLHSIENNATRLDHLLIDSGSEPQSIFQPILPTDKDLEEYFNSRNFS
jgi:hypothetical protein